MNLIDHLTLLELILVDGGSELGKLTILESQGLVHAVVLVLKFRDELAEAEGLLLLVAEGLGELLVGYGHAGGFLSLLLVLLYLLLPLSL